MAFDHADWLALLAPTGPFLSLPVLLDVFHSGLDTIPEAARARVRQAWSEFDADPAGLGAAWIDLVLAELLRYPESVLHEAAGTDLEFSGPVRPDQVVYGPDPDGTRATRMHVYRRPAGQPVSELDELAEMAGRVCRAGGVPVALVTDGRFWLLVHAVSGGPTSVARFDADLWSEEPTLLRAFYTLLSATRVLTPARRADGAASDSLAALFARTADEQSVITNTLGGQVRQAVELFVAELARLDRESGGGLLGEVADRDIYRGSLTTLMRLVFLLYAEQRELLPIKDPVYADGYAVTTLYAQLAEDRDRFGDEVADRRTAAWPRLLATFAAIHGGCEHPDLRIPPHGGSLFDPGRFPWLRRAAVTDRVVHEILEALLLLRHRGGKAAERLSYTGLDVEQIGHVYEGLLEFSCLHVDEPYVGLRGKNEPEVPLVLVEEKAASGSAKFAEWLVAESGSTPKQVADRLAKEPSQVELAALHAACDNDGELAERVRPFWGLLRIDLRKQPTVFPANSVLFTQVGDRRATGTHYTPKEMAVEVVEHTLAPLCAGKSAGELLKLKVCDPTMGSGAFLVSACRYLAERVVEAWERDGFPEEVGGTREDIELTALRWVAARCIYGVDRDPMAVDLAKLSMWLVTLAKDKPFGFLDHALRCGDSLIGVLDEAQVEWLHLDPEAGGRDAAIRTSGPIYEYLGPVLAEVTELRQKIEASPVDHYEQLVEKETDLKRADELTERLKLVADGVVGAALSTAGKGEAQYKGRLTGIAEDAQNYATGEEAEGVEDRLKKLIGAWLVGKRDAAVRPFHWALEFPEVMRNGGFDAVVGNPPFIGGTLISGRVGSDLLRYFQAVLASGKRSSGRADLCAYFLLRDLDITKAGRVGIVATNTIAQGDTREVGLDQVVQRGWAIYRAVKSQPWPGTASLEVSLVWIGTAVDKETHYLDGRVVSGITPTLDSRSRVSGNPYRLQVNAGRSSMGSYVLGTGFVLEPDRAHELIRRDTRNRDVLFPYLNGEDVNSRPDCSASRWVINFHDWGIDRAQDYFDVLQIVETEVRPERAAKDPRTYAGLMDHWWRYWRVRSDLLRAIASLDRVLVISLVSKTCMPLLVSTGQVFSHKLGVYTTDRTAHLALLSSTMHTSWAWRNSSTLETRLNYSLSDAFETFPQPELTEWLDRVGKELHSFRRSVMLEQQLGLTKLYNLVHDESQRAEDVRRLREIHVEVDAAVATAYGWTDLDLGHGFHDTRQGRRFTIDPAVQVEVLDRLLELNFARYDEEVKKGLHGKGKRRAAAPAQKTLDGSIDGGLFAPDNTLF